MLRAALPAAALLLAAPALGERLTLDDALAIAGKAGGDVQLSRLQLESAQVDRFASYAGVLPRLDLSLGFQRSFMGAQSSIFTVPSIALDPATRLPVYDPASGRLDLSFRQEVVELPATSFPDYSLKLVLLQPLFDGRRSWSQIERAQRGVEAARRQLDETSLSQSFEVIRRFLEVVKAQRSEAVLEETARRSEALVRRSQALFEAGRLQRSEVIAAEVNLGNDRISLASQRARAEQAHADLAALLGRSPDDPFEAAPPADIDAEGLKNLEVPALTPLLERARRDRPLLTRQRELVGQAELDQRIASADRYPTVSAQAAYSRSGPTFSGRDGVYGDPSRQYAAAAQLEVKWNLFNGRQTSANEQRAAVAERQARLQAELARRQVEGEVAKARAGLAALAQAERLARGNLGAAEEGVRLAEQRLDAGLATALDVRDATLKLTQAKLTLVNARIDRVVAQADLARAVGGSYREISR